jgi:phosphoribosylaminoimidazolecarboxamide formyltransferase/IMP cyclohydrolase
MTSSKKLHGKELSYNNILDITAAAELIDEFSDPTVAILKHTNPCGVGSDPDLREAWDKAFATDKQAPFGGIIICNQTLTLPLARAIAEIFSEVIIAPDFEADARALLQKKKNLRLMKKLPRPLPTSEEDEVLIRSVAAECSCRAAMKRRRSTSRARSSPSANRRRRNWRP